MDWFAPDPAPEVFQAGLALGGQDLQAEGAAYLGVPVLGGGTLPAGTSVLMARVGDRGAVAFPVGGYYAPAANEVTP